VLFFSKNFPLLDNIFNSIQHPEVVQENSDRVQIVFALGDFENSPLAALEHEDSGEITK